MYVHIYIYIYIYVHTHTYTYIYIIYIYIYLSICLSIYLSNHSHNCCGCSGGPGELLALRAQEVAWDNKNVRIYIIEYDIIVKYVITSIRYL